MQSGTWSVACLPLSQCSCSNGVALGGHQIEPRSSLRTKLPQPLALTTATAPTAVSFPVSSSSPDAVTSPASLEFSRMAEVPVHVRRGISVH